MTDVQRSLVLVKPDGVRRGLSGEVLRRIEAKGYTLAAVELRSATPELLAEHYAEHEGKPFYGPLVDFMLSGPVLAVVIEGERCIEGFRSLAGATDPTVAPPGTIRGDLGRDWGLAVQQNLVHGSDSEESAAREIGIWFPSWSLSGAQALRPPPSSPPSRSPSTPPRPPWDVARRATRPLGRAGQDRGQDRAQHPSAGGRAALGAHLLGQVGQHDRREQGEQLLHQEPLTPVEPSCWTTCSCCAPKMWRVICSPSCSSTSSRSTGGVATAVSCCWRASASDASPPGSSALARRPPSRAGSATSTACRTASGSSPRRAAIWSMGREARSSSRSAMPRP